MAGRLQHSFLFPGAGLLGDRGFWEHPAYRGGGRELSVVAEI